MANGMRSVGSDVHAHATTLAPRLEGLDNAFIPWHKAAVAGG
jgi:hypothetical protein